MRILGVDPGTVHIGYANVINGFPINFGCENIDINKSLYLESIDILNNLVMINKPELVIIESFFGRGWTPKIIGAMEYYLESNKIEWNEVTPNEVKKNLTGNYKSSKTQVINKINEMFNTNLKYNKSNGNSHMADAIAIALTYKGEN